LHSWNPDDCSKNIYIKDDGFTYHRSAITQSTDAARSRIGFRSGRHCWDIWWERAMGSHAVIGVALRQAPMQERGYISLVGGNLYSWDGTQLIVCCITICYGTKYLARCCNCTYEFSFDT
jgi:F-box protein 45